MTACLTSCGLVFGDGTCQTIAASGAVCVQTFCATGSWTMPSGTQFVMAEIISGGAGGNGGGCGGSASNSGYGGGGGGGISITFPASLITSPVCVVVGAGGSGGCGCLASYYTNGTSGGYSCFGCYAIVSGGCGTSGASGGVLNSIGTKAEACLIYNGGRGGVQQYYSQFGPGDSIWGAGGGGAGGYVDTSVAYNASKGYCGGNSVRGGTGGCGGSTCCTATQPGCPGQPGTFPGGGGGAGATGSTGAYCGGCGGPGAGGRVIVYSW